MRETLPWTGLAIGLLAVVVEALIGSRYWPNISVFIMMPVTVAVYVLFALFGAILAEWLDLP